MAPLHLRVVRSHGETAVARPRRAPQARRPRRSTARLHLVPAPPPASQRPWAPYAATLFLVALVTSIAAFAGIAGLTQTAGWVFAGLAGLLSFGTPAPRSGRRGSA